MRIKRTRALRVVVAVTGGLLALVAALMTTLPGTPASAQVAATVDIKDFAFQPRDITINVGMMIRWINQDEWPHQVAAEDGKTVGSPLIRPGNDFTVTLTQPGRFPYRCGVHPTMLGEIIVQGP